MDLMSMAVGLKHTLRHLPLWLFRVPEDPMGGRQSSLCGPLRWRLLSLSSRSARCADCLIAPGPQAEAKQQQCIGSAVMPTNQGHADECICETNWCWSG